MHVGLKVGSTLAKGVMLSDLMLDSDKHPTLHYVGDCTPNMSNGKVNTRLVGSLSIKGKTTRLFLPYRCILLKTHLQALPALLNLTHKNGA